MIQTPTYRLGEGRVMDNTAKNIFMRNPVGVLGTVDETGEPHTTPLHCVYYNNSIGWFSDANSQHARNGVNSKTVSLSFFSPQTAEGLEGVYIKGPVVAVTGADYEALREAFIEQYGRLPQTLEGADAYKVVIDTTKEEKKFGNCWYFYS